ncbi:MAG: Cell wall-associated hydrolase [Frankiales bacterium]|nr:Cell wall-associated hydrolase [Frankiales bacterium]
MTYAPRMDTVPALLRDLPTWFWEVPFVASRSPGAVARSGLRQGGNSQLFAYEVLAHFGFRIPDVRSAELWRDTDATRVVLESRPLDLALFHDREQAWGAHVGVVVSDTEVLHLCAEVGTPTIWSWDDFASRTRYAHLIGFKRPLLPG